MRFRRRLRVLHNCSPENKKPNSAKELGRKAGLQKFRLSPFQITDSRTPPTQRSNREGRRGSFLPCPARRDYKNRSRAFPLLFSNEIVPAAVGFFSGRQRESENLQPLFYAALKDAAIGGRANKWEFSRRVVNRRRSCQVPHSKQPPRLRGAGRRPS